MSEGGDIVGEMQRSLLNCYPNPPKTKSHNVHIHNANKLFATTKYISIGINVKPKMIVRERVIATTKA